MKHAPWTARDFGARQGKASSWTGPEACLNAVEVERHGAGPKHRKADITLGFWFKSGFACYGELRTCQDRNVR